MGGMVNSITVQLGNEPGDEPGALRYTVEFPDTVSEASLVLVSMGEGGDSAPVDLLAGSTLSGGVRTRSGILNAEAGNYLLNIDLYGSAGNAGKTEVVHIYSNTETVGAYTMSAGDFSPAAEYRTGSGQNLYAALTAIGGIHPARRILPFYWMRTNRPLRPLPWTTLLLGARRYVSVAGDTRLPLTGQVPSLP